MIRRQRARKRVRPLRRRAAGKAPIGRARAALRTFRKASLLAVAMTSLLLMITDPQSADAEEPQTAGAEAAAATATGAANEQARAGSRQTPSADARQKRASVASAPPGDHEDPTLDTSEVAKAAGNEAKRTFRELKRAALASLPKLALVLGLLAAAWLTVRAMRLVLRRTLHEWPRSTAMVALSGVAIWSIALGICVTVIAGDVRAFLGSVGLLGLAASWALQTPIESFTGWLLNAFKGYYRTGDRVEVGDVFGDIYRIDVLTTTVWEIGSPFRPGFVHAEQPTGRLITFPNNQILTGSVVNLTRDFPYLWDELSVSVANESDIRYAMAVLERIATELLAGTMRDPALQYQSVLQREGLEETVPDHPQVFVSAEDAWTSLQVRYLVHARQRRKWKTELILRVGEELARPEHLERIIPVVPRQQIQLIGTDGRARNVQWFEPPPEEG